MYHRQKCLKRSRNGPCFKISHRSHRTGITQLDISMESGLQMYHFEIDRHTRYGITSVWKKDYCNKTRVVLGGISHWNTTHWCEAKNTNHMGNTTNAWSHTTGMPTCFSASCTNMYQSKAKWHQNRSVHSLTHSSRSRFLPCLAGMVMIATETLLNTLFKVCLNDSGIVMFAREVQPWKAASPMWVTDSGKVMLASERQFWKAPSPMWVTDSPKVMLGREVHPEKACSSMWVTDSPKVMLSREVHPWKAFLPMWVTDSGIVSKTSWCKFWKAAAEIFVALEGIFTSKHPCVWMSCFVVASASFLVYVTVTRGSAPKNPAASSVSASSMIELPRSSSTLRTLRSIGSWQGCFSRSIAFNSRTVAVITTSRVMTPPCNVFTWTSQGMAFLGPIDRQDLTKGIALCIQVVLWAKSKHVKHMNRVLKAGFSPLFLLLYLLLRMSKEDWKFYAYSDLWIMSYLEPSPLDCPLLSKPFMVPSWNLCSKTIPPKHVSKHSRTTF